MSNKSSSVHSLLHKVLSLSNGLPFYLYTAKMLYSSWTFSHLKLPTKQTVFTKKWAVISGISYPGHVTYLVFYHLSLAPNINTRPYLIHHETTRNEPIYNWVITRLHSKSWDCSRLLHISEKGDSVFHVIPSPHISCWSLFNFFIGWITIYHT